MAAKGLYSTGTAAKVCGVSMRTVDFWVRNGLAPATVAAADTGSDRWYSFDDLVVLAAMAELARDTNVVTRRLVAREIRRKPAAEIMELRVSPILTIIGNLERLREIVRAGIKAETD